MITALLKSSCLQLLDNESQQDNYSITNKNLSPESSPLLTPEPQEENHIVPGPVSVTVHNASDQLQVEIQVSLSSFPIYTF